MTMTYIFSFEIAGDFKSSPMSKSEITHASSLEDAVEHVWDSYTIILNRITKPPYEAAVFFEPRVSPLLSITGSCDDIPLDETTMLDAFYRVRIRKFHENQPKWR